MKQSTLFFMIFFIFFLFPTNSYAYLDPGTGSMILQSILGILFFVGAGIGIFWRRIKGILGGSKKTKKSKTYSAE